MKTTKQILCMILSVAILAAFTVCASAASTITIGDVTFSEYVDESGVVDETLVTVIVQFTAADTTEQISVLLTSENISDITEANESKVVYLEQVETPTTGEYEFVVEKQRIMDATGLTDIEGCTLYLKIGGTDSDEAASKTITYSEPESTYVYGDVTGDGVVDIGDAIQVLRYEAGSRTFTAEQLIVGDVNSDDAVDIGDAVRILRYEAGLITSVR